MKNCANKLATRWQTWNIKSPTISYNHHPNFPTCLGWKTLKAHPKKHPTNLQSNFLLLFLRCHLSFCLRFRLSFRLCFRCSFRQGFRLRFRCSFCPGFRLRFRCSFRRSFRQSFRLWLRCRCPHIFHISIFLSCLLHVRKAIWDVAIHKARITTPWLDRNLFRLWVDNIGGNDLLLLQVTKMFPVPKHAWLVVWGKKRTFYPKFRNNQKISKHAKTIQNFCWHSVLQLCNSHTMYKKVQSLEKRCEWLEKRCTKSSWLAP